MNEIPMTAISRFLRDIKVLDLVGNKDLLTIQKAIDSCITHARSEAYTVSMPEIMKSPGENTKNW